MTRSMFMELLLTLMKVPLKIFRSRNMWMIFLTLGLTPLILNRHNRVKHKRTHVRQFQTLRGGCREGLKELTLECAQRTPGCSWQEEEEEEVSAGFVPDALHP